MAAHARLSPSGADRWMTCPGSVRLIERLTLEGAVRQDRTSVFAAEGTAAHEVRALSLDLGLDPHDFIGREFDADGFTFDVTEEMADHLMPGIDWIREQTAPRASGKQDVMVVEDRTDLGHFLPGQFGTLDLGILRDDAIIISDLKFGAGVPVDAVQNRQLMIYALGFWFTYGHGRRPLARRVILNIDQPRAGGMKFWELDRSDLLAFGEEARAAALAVDDPDAPLVASEKGCRWCPVRQTEWGCATYDQLMGSLTASALLDLDDESPEMFPPERMTPERRYYTVRHAHLVTAWLAKLHEDSLRAAEAGRPDPGSKAVTGQKGDRKFNDQDAAEAILVDAIGKDSAFTRKLITPTRAERLMKPGRKRKGHPEAWDALKELVTQSDGKPILVPVEDGREALTSTLDRLLDDDD